jgi:hypothetical protein
VRLPEDSIERLVAARLRAADRPRLLGRRPFCGCCGEEEVFALTRHDGVTVCYRCRAILRSRLSRSGRPGCCLACGVVSPTGAGIERHHELGRAHHATATVCLCLNCHALVSEYQRYLGVDLAPQADRVSRVTQGAISSLALVAVILKRRVAPVGRVLSLAPAVLIAALALVEASREAP